MKKLLHFSGVTHRNMHFCLNGLKEVQAELKELNIGFSLARGWERDNEKQSPGEYLGEFLQDNHKGACVVVDFSALRAHRAIVDDLVETLPSDTTVYQVHEDDGKPGHCLHLSLSLEGSFGGAGMGRSCTKLLKMLIFFFFQVDAHNIVPIWETSDKQEYAARTIRKKIMDKLNTYLTDFPHVIRYGHYQVLK